MTELNLQCRADEEFVNRYGVCLGPTGTSPDMQLVISLADLMDYHETFTDYTPEGRKAAIQWFIARYSHD